MYHLVLTAWSLCSGRGRLQLGAHMIDKLGVGLVLFDKKTMILAKMLGMLSADIMGFDISRFFLVRDFFWYTIEAKMLSDHNAVTTWTILMANMNVWWRR